MSEQPRPPVITIRDPRAPTDVIGVGPARTGSQRRLALLASAIVATAGVGLLSIGQMRHDRELDAASVRALRLMSIPAARSSFRGGNDDVGLALLNQGDGPVTVLSARYDAPGFPELRPRDGAVRPSNTTFLRFALSGPCPAAAPVTRGDGSVLVTVRTARGVRTTLRLNDDDALGFGSDYLSALARRCGLYRPGDSLVPEAEPRVDRLGPDLRLRYVLHNAAHDPRILRSLVVTGGLEVVGAPLPLAFAGDASHPLVVRLRITSCANARRAWGFAPTQQGTTPTFEAVEADGVVSLVVEGDGRLDQAHAFLRAGQVGEVRRWITGRCG